MTVANAQPIRCTVAFLLLSIPCLSPAHAQNVATAIGPGSYIALGAELTAFQVDYGHRILGGGAFVAELNPTWRIGMECEARYLRYNSFEQVTESNYLAGPRVMLKPGPLRPYVKVLFGAGKITLPYHYAQGTFFTYAPGAGADYLLNDRISLRLIDFEYQLWPGFSSYGELRPYGLSAGIIVRLNPVAHLPTTANHWRWH